MLVVELLGSPTARDPDGGVRSPKGRKTWALLAYLLLAERPPTRSKLAETFHSGADDPLGALRWTLADLRRLLGDGSEIVGDPVTIDPGPAVSVDVTHLDRAAVAANGSPGLLLDGLTFRGTPQLESWLDLERHRLHARISSMTREAAVSALASGDASEAVRLSERLVDMQPLDERHHALLVRSLVASGDTFAARRRAGVASDLLSRELDSKETKLIDAALSTAGAGGVASPRSIDALVVAGRAAMGAGVPDAALRTLGSALRDARNSPDKHVLVNALLGLAEALSHSVRGLDEIALDLLYEAEAIAAADGDATKLAVARREIGYIELLRGDYHASDRWFKRALEAGPDPEDRSLIEAYRGTTLVDRGMFDEAIDVLDGAVEASRRQGHAHPLAFALAMLGRAYVVRGEYASAIPVLEESIDVTRKAGRIALQPLPEALLAQALLGMGQVEQARELAGSSFALACEIGDPCWEGISGHALALADIQGGEIDRALERLEDAYRRATRLPDSWTWLNGYVLAALAEVLVEVDPERAEESLRSLEAIAYPSNMQDLIERANAIRRRLKSELTELVT